MIQLLVISNEISLHSNCDTKEERDVQDAALNPFDIAQAKEESSHKPCRPSVGKVACSPGSLSHLLVTPSLNVHHSVRTRSPLTSGASPHNFRSSIVVESSLSYLDVSLISAPMRCSTNHLFNRLIGSRRAIENRYEYPPTLQPKHSALMLVLSTSSHV